MAFAPIPEYEGKSPYVFITYAQQDERIAYSIAVKMYNEGFRIWSSAACGNPSNMRIAERLSNSEVAMVFLSKSYLQYASYKEFEPRVVMSSPKSKIVICLDDTPLGTDWNTVDFPAGIRYNPEIPQDLWLKINSSDALERCRGAWPKHPMPLPFEDNPIINVSVNEEELSDELSNLNSVMSSFGAGLDADDIKNITLFQKKNKNENKFEWKDKHETTQEQEYYAIENLIDTAPMPVPGEKKQYDNMIGLIENFMKKSSLMKEEELRRRMAENSSDATNSAKLPQVNELHEDYLPVPINEFDNVDMTKDASNEPVVFTESSEKPQIYDSDEFTPIVIDYDDEMDHANYDMVRNSNRIDSLLNTAVNNSDEQMTNEDADSVNVYEPPVLSYESEQEAASASDDSRLTYHLGGALSGFDERSGNAQEDSIPAEPSSAEFKPVESNLSRFTDNDDIPLPALSFAKPIPDADSNSQSVQKVSPKSYKRCIVSVRTKVRRVKYENEMYKVNGRWIPGEMYHEKMPNAKYTVVKNIAVPTTEEAAPQSTHSFRTSQRFRLNSNSRLFNAVNTFFAPPTQSHKSVDMISDSIRSAVRERREIQSMEADNNFAKYAESDLKNNIPASEENTPARKHKFSHEAGIKKSLMLPMENPIEVGADESYRQHGIKAETSLSDESKKSDGKKDKKGKKSDKISPVGDEDTLIAIPTYGKQPKINYDPSAYSDMNLSEILFGDKEKPSKKKKKKK